MKNIFTFLFALITLTCFAQVPQGVSYQAVAFNSGGNPVANGTVGVKVSILDNSATGTVVYSETHTKSTNAQGLFNLNIGQGTATSGTFSGINWGTNSKFLKVEVDPTGGTSYTNVGVNQLMSVPYALFAEESGNSILNGNSSIGSQLIESKLTNIVFDDYTDYKIYVFNSSKSTWSSQTYNSNVNPTIILNNGSVSFDDYADKKIYVYDANSGNWSSQTYNSNVNPTIEIDTLTGSFFFDDYTDNKIYSYSVITHQWSSQAYNSNVNPTLILSKGNIAFDDYIDNKVYVFNKDFGNWSSQSYNSNVNPTINSSNGNFFFDDYTDNIIYIYNDKTNSWHSQAYNSNVNPTIVTSEAK